MVADQLGFHEHRANSLEIVENTLTGHVIPPILGREAKVEALEAITAARGVTPADAITVGDGANDLGMLAAAGLEHPAQLNAKHLVRRISRTEIKLFSQLHVFLKPGELLTGEANGEFYSRMWQMARADSFEPDVIAAA